MKRRRRRRRRRRLRLTELLRKLSASRLFRANKSQKFCKPTARPCVDPKRDLTLANSPAPGPLNALPSPPLSPLLAYSSMQSGTEQNGTLCFWPDPLLLASTTGMTCCCCSVWWIRGGVVWWVGVFKSFAALPAQKFGCKIAARSAGILQQFTACSFWPSPTESEQLQMESESASRGGAAANVDAGN